MENPFEAPGLFKSPKQSRAPSGFTRRGFTTKENLLTNCRNIVFSKWIKFVT